MKRAYQGRLAREYGILCFEMEATGLMDYVPSLQMKWHISANPGIRMPRNRFAPYC
jgi:hypothetical protein